MSSLEVAMWVLGGVGAIIFGALVRLRSDMHKIDKRVTRVETKLGLNGKEE